METLLANQAELVGVFNQFISNFKKTGAERKTVDYFKKKLNQLEQYWSEFQNNHFQLCQYDRDHSYFTTSQFDKTKQVYENIKATIKNQYEALLSRPISPNPAAREQQVEQAPAAALAGAQQPDKRSPGVRDYASSSRSEDMLRKQAANFKAFLRTVGNIDLEEITEKWELESTIKTLQMRWMAIDSLHWEIESELNGENEAYDNTFSKHEATFNQLNKQINKKLWSVSHREYATPRMDVPEFHGSYSEWVSFKDLFTEAIHNNSSISSAQKMQFLKNKVKGEAERLIQHLPISSDNYAVCWDILNHRFNNKNAIFNSHISTLLSFQTMQQQSLGQIKKLHDLSNECLNAIKNLGLDISSWDPLLVYLLSNKLDNQSYNDYIESRNNSRELPVLEDFLKFLEIKFNILESSQRKEGIKKSQATQPQISSSKSQPKYQEGKAKSMTSNAIQTEQNNENTSSLKSNLSIKENNEILLATALVKVKSVDGSDHTLRALVDQGSQISLITERAAQQLGIKRQKCQGIIVGVGDKHNSSKGTIGIKCTSLNSEFSFTTGVYIMNHLINHLPSKSFPKPSWSHINHIKLADPEFYQSREVDLLLGADIYSMIMLDGIIKGEVQSQPIAQQTHLGWILFGTVSKFHCNVVINNLDDIKRFWEMEDITEQSTLSKDDQFCVELYQKTTTRQSDGRYVVKLPLVPEFEEKLGTSKPQAIAQFRNLEKKFYHNEKIATAYKEFINEYRFLGHMEPASSSSSAPQCYLPHHCILRDESATSALRVVFNASCRTSTGFSLNDLMHRGPNLQQDLQSLIIKWRQYQYAYTADIEKMYRQILVHPEERQLQKIIWRDSNQQPLQEYQLSTLTYGMKPAGYLAMMTLRQLGKEVNQSESEVARVLEESFYMDDLVHGSHSIESALELQEQLIKLLKSAGFNLRKWASNEKQILEQVQGEATQFSFDFKQAETTKMLGLRWKPESDIFVFQLKIEELSKLTKRALLSDISKLFDPLGWLSPLTTKLKLLFQKVWLTSLDWDDKLPENLIKEWLSFRNDLQSINQIKVPRWLNTKNQDNVELHGFCDSSIKAYACVVYCRVSKDGESTVTLIAGKARLVPVNKNISLPRLELNGAVLLTKLMSKIRSCLSNHLIKTIGWTDSTAVLGWIQGDIGRWTPYVANRVQQIREIMPPENWNYVKSSENSADCASRGQSASQLSENRLWWDGPEWLKSYKSDEPSQQTVFITDLETRQCKQTNVITTDDNIIGTLLSKHSKLVRVIRVIAWLLRFTKTKSVKKEPYITLSEIKQAKIIIIKYVQEEEFSEEITRLRKGQKISADSKLLQLTPFLDKDGLLRVGGRLKHANITEDQKHPTIIPHNGKLTELLIDNAHTLSLHGGPRLTLATLRRHYWIIGGNRAVKKCLRRCVICRRNTPSKQVQIMGELPEERITPSRPFEHTGVDFTGFIDVKSNKGRGIKSSKGYVAVFICMVTKAVHLELVSDLSTSSMIAAMRRLAAKRGTPSHIYSDNGTNFVGSSRVIKQELSELKEVFNEEFFDEINQMEIEWHFIAPSWPNAGGLWESAVKSFKYHFKRFIGNQKLTYEELSTLLAQIEACLNSRPLCQLSEDPDDINFLTPAHFLSGGPNLTLVETERDERTRWCLSQKLFQDIWKRWRDEYLVQLSSRSKWRQSKENVRKDDVVIISDANLPPGKWAMGKVVEVHPGSDGYVRVVTLKTKNGFLKRPQEENE
ncbi:uncharacterized protein LOC125489576 [Plutella xylostella]|uniref:uncharacterized protein LOC125489576 n=1 Tax=Plutella xylostella TaxID=51655 RepID=UPI00203273E9|nr:uncharacterized protein LOC125489576 [Plutella xylostella]